MKVRSFILVSLAMYFVAFAAGGMAADALALTPLGAEKGGNADKTIPPWTGGIITPPQRI